MRIKSYLVEVNDFRFKSEFKKTTMKSISLIVGSVFPREFDEELPNSECTRESFNVRKSFVSYEEREALV